MAKKKTSVADCVRRITGADPNQTSVGRPATVALARALADIDLSGLTSGQLCHLERVLSGGLAAVQGEHLRRAYHVRDWLKNGPDMSRHGAYSHAWIDHPSKLVSKETGTTYFRSEPYEIGEDGLRRLVALIDAGWDVIIRADESDHFPGRTLAVLVSKKDDHRKTDDSYDPEEES
jgi:hypothetical protein